MSAVKHGIVFENYVDAPLGKLQFRPKPVPVTDVDGRKFTVGQNSEWGPLVTDVATGRRWGMELGAMLALARSEGLAPTVAGTLVNHADRQIDKDGILGTAEELIVISDARERAGGGMYSTIATKSVANALICGVEVLARMIDQDCRVILDPDLRPDGIPRAVPTGSVYSGGIRAHADAIRYLAHVGRMRIEFDGGTDSRIVYATWANPPMDPVDAEIARAQLKGQVA